MKNSEVKVIREFCLICLVALSITISLIFLTSKEWLITDKYRGHCNITGSFNSCPEITIKGTFTNREGNTIDFIRHLTITSRCYDIYLSLINNDEYVTCYKYEENVYFEVEFDRNAIAIFTITINVICIVYIGILCFIKMKKNNRLVNEGRYSVIMNY